MQISIIKRNVKSVVKEIENYESQGIYLISWVLYHVDGSFFKKKIGSYYVLNGSFSNDKPETSWKIESKQLKGGYKQRRVETEKFLDNMRDIVGKDSTILDFDTITNDKDNEIVCSISYIPKK